LKKGEVEMNTNMILETFVEQKVTYTLEMEVKFFIIENVPARVCVETGEQLFSPETVQRIQQMIRGKEKPSRIIETPVYEFMAG
jgi:YgiT-type zinc finger domain-containing protein